MIIDVWFDVVCPFCYIGRRRLSNVLAQIKHGKEIEVRYRAYQLSPEAPHQTDDDLNTLLQHRYGMSRAEAIEANRGVAELGRVVGLSFAFDRARWANTRDAHRLIKLAALNGRENEMLEILFSAFFAEGMLIGETDTLISLGARAGLSVDAVTALLNSNLFAAEIAKDRSDGAHEGLHGVPFYVVGQERGGSEIITTGNLRRLLRQERST